MGPSTALFFAAALLLGGACSVVTDLDGLRGKGGSGGNPPPDAGVGGASECAAPFLDCNRSPDDGCEVDARHDSLHCGDCGTRCDGATPFCVDGMCAATCPLALCDGMCVDLGTSVAHCGTCDHPCGARPDVHATPACEGGQCAYECAAGFSDCDGDAANGCEVSTNGNDPAHCGSCAPCAPVVGGTPTCTAGRCGVECAAPFLDCDGDLANGCECDGASHRCQNAACVACGANGTGCWSALDCCDPNASCLNSIYACCVVPGGSCKATSDCCVGVCDAQQHCG